MDIFPLLQSARTRGASDLHLMVSSPPLLRINGQLEPTAEVSPLTSDDMEQAFNQLTSDKEKADFSVVWNWTLVTLSLMSGGCGATRLGSAGQSALSSACCHRSFPLLTTWDYLMCAGSWFLNGGGW